MNEAELQYEGCRGTVVYKTMMKRAESWRYEILEVDPAEYKIRRVHDKQIDMKLKSDVHNLLVLAED